MVPRAMLLPWSCKVLIQRVLRVAVSPSRSSRLDPEIDKYVNERLHRQSTSPPSSNDTSGPLISRLPTVFISTLAHIDLPVAGGINGTHYVPEEISSCTSGFTILACIASYIVNYSYDIIGARIVRGRIGKNQAHVPICSPRL